MICCGPRKVRLNGNIITDTRHQSLPGDHSELAYSRRPHGFDIWTARQGLQSDYIGRIQPRRRADGLPLSAPIPAKDLPARTWSLNVDLKAPVTDRLGFQGEYYIGENLEHYLGGILQGYDPVLRKSIYDTGGWMEVWYDWSPQWHSHVGYCIDDPLNSDISAGGRTYNQAYFGNIIYDVTKQFKLGLEASSWRTLYNGKDAGRSSPHRVHGPVWILM